MKGSCSYYLDFISHFLMIVVEVNCCVYYEDVWMGVCHGWLAVSHGWLGGSHGWLPENHLCCKSPLFCQLDFMGVIRIS